MTDPQLGDLMRRVPDQLDADAADRILGAALSSGDRRRHGRRLAVVGTGVSAAAVVAVAVAAAGLSGPGTAHDEPTAVASEPTAPLSSAAPTYARGSRDEVPGGPVIDTDRAIADDDALAAAVRALLPEGEIDNVQVAHVESRVSGHRADKTRDGRQVSLAYDGASVALTVQRWDGYAAVGVAGIGDADHLEDVLSRGDQLEQQVATTAREACAGAYTVSPPMQCTEDEGGWHRIARPSQGASAPDTYQELYVTFFTDDGWVITVDSYNTPAEKSGPPVADEPVLSVEESLAMVRSDRWFVAR